MLIQTGFLIPGVAGTPFCASQCCKYVVNVANFGSDADDDPYYLVGVQTVSGLVTFPNNAEPDMRNYVLLEDALNALGIGTFRVAPVPDDRTQITSEDNPNQLVGIRVRIEGQTHDIPFHECDCHDITPCEEGIEKCTYYLFRKFETSNNDKIRLKAVKFVNTAPYTTQPIDTEDYRAIANWLNTLPESSGKFTANYANNTLTLQAPSLKYKPEYVVWEIETATISAGTVTGTQKQDKQTFFVKTDCFTDCCCCCGADGQPPCKTQNGNNGCNAPLELHLDGLCRPACVAGRALIAGNWVAAGNVGQPVDCKGKCFGNLVPTNYGCQPASQNATVCDLSFVVETNENEKLISIVFGNLGVYKPATPILLGATGADVLAWLNAPETGLCPPGTGNCVTANVAAIPDTNLKKFAFTLSAVNLDVTGTKDPVTVTAQYADTPYNTYVLPQNCTETELNLTCPHGQVFNINFARCVNVTPQSVCAGAGAFTGAAVSCYEHRPITTGEYERNKEALIAGKIIVIQSQYNDAVVRWYSTRGLATDYRGYAIHLLIAEGKLPEWEAICYQTAGGKLRP